MESLLIFWLQHYLDKAKVNADSSDDEGKFDPVAFPRQAQQML